MSERPGLFAVSKHPVLSLNAQAQIEPRREQPRFEVLVRHLLHRFFHNELIGSDDETKRILQISYAVALPGLLVAMFLFPSYHAFPPYPFPRPFWPQVGDHYFYVMYSFVLLGAATVYEWDLLFPDLLDVFILSILPITNRRLFFARVLALAIFLALVLAGTSILGTLALPLIADLANPGRHLLAHAIAVGMSGAFAAATFLALQGTLLVTIGQRLFRRITPVLQGMSLMLMLTVLLLYPTLSHSLEMLLTSGSLAVRYFPPFWFLGVYQVLLNGNSGPPVFRELAHTGVWALAIGFAVTLTTYPVAYRRRVRQVVEGATAAVPVDRSSAIFRRLLHSIVLRTPWDRATFHFISQTLLRSPRHRVMLAMYGGLGVALTLANMVLLHVHGTHVRPALLPLGIRAAVPILVFWTVVGLRSAIAAPIDRRGTWLFRVVIGRARSGHLAGARIWISTCAAVMGVAAVLLLHSVAPAGLRTPLVTAGQILIAIGLPILLSDLLLYSVRTIPFSHLRVSSITDFPLMIVRNVILFPALVAVVLHYERSIEASLTHLVGTALVLAGLHRWLVHAHSRSLQDSTLETPPAEEDDFPQSLGLRNS